MAEPEFEKSIFLNCPFDKDYQGILQAILFSIIYLGYEPRLASERMDSAEVRIEKIVGLIEGCKYSIHDLSRCQAVESGEYYRLNMPFELGIDYACRRYFGRGRNSKKVLILEEQKYRYQAVISDLAGFDIADHGGDFQKAIRKARNWLVSEAAVDADGATKIFGAYFDFQEWYYETQLAAGFSEEDIQDYPTSELLGAMRKWFALGKPLEA